jgi:hypothetical protein
VLRFHFRARFGVWCLQEASHGDVQIVAIANMKLTIIITIITTSSSSSSIAVIKITTCIITIRISSSTCCCQRTTAAAAMRAPSATPHWHKRNSPHPRSIPLLLNSPRLPSTAVSIRPHHALHLDKMFHQVTGAIEELHLLALRRLTMPMLPMLPMLPMQPVALGSEVRARL